MTGGPAVNESLETSIPGVFAAGNVLHVHDLVDYVSEEAGAAGAHAAAFIQQGARGRTPPPSPSGAPTASATRCPAPSGPPARGTS